MSTKDSKKDQPCSLNGIIGSISFSKHSYLKTRITAKANINLFEESVILDIGEGYIRIARPDIDFTGKTYKFNKMKSGWFGTTIQKQLPLGKFLFDKEESSEDELIAYYR